MRARLEQDRVLRPELVGTCCAAIGSTIALICAVDMLGSMIFTFGPKSGADRTEWCAAAAVAASGREGDRPYESKREHLVLRS